ncbi:MAG: hypothetical protein A49_25670 [Methyloceanibacter sp.]|nr:MAG: hypothetical protein A49_25670 [Methyloceanibacter sp.]
MAVAILCCTGLSSGVEAAQPGQSPWVDQTNSKVRLVSGTLSEDSNSALYAGVQLRMDPGWKTYWRNPGDSGVPPSFDWSGSKNLKHAEVLFPIPHRFADANGTAIGYDDEVVFPVRITPKDAGTPVQLSLTLDYGLCKELCIPNSVELNAKLPANLGKGDAALIRQAKARIPQPAGDGALPRIGTVTAKLDGPRHGSSSKRCSRTVHEYRSLRHQRGDSGSGAQSARAAEGRQAALRRHSCIAGRSGRRQRKTADIHPGLRPRCA